MLLRHTVLRTLLWEDVAARYGAADTAGRSDVAARYGDTVRQTLLWEEPSNAKQDGTDANNKTKKPRFQRNPQQNNEDLANHRPCQDSVQVQNLKLTKYKLHLLSAIKNAPATS